MYDFALIRILGNDLPPRHASGQTFKNTKFILENEMQFMSCKKMWIVNRIVDRREEKKIINLLDSYDQEYIHLPFVHLEFDKIRKLKQQDAYQKYSHLDLKRIGTKDYAKLLYIMNLNSARNRALAEGKKIARWILPLDGNCILTQTNWGKMQEFVKKTDEMYLLLHMYRLLDNADFYDFDPLNKIEFEPQIMFRNDSIEVFNEDYCWGKRSKVELLIRLGMNPIRDNNFACSNVKYKAGYVLRLFSGVEKGEGHPDTRGRLRYKAYLNILWKIEGLKRLSTILMYYYYFMVYHLFIKRKQNKNN
jgi:hypothetical protein